MIADQVKTQAYELQERGIYEYFHASEDGKNLQEAKMNIEVKMMIAYLTFILITRILLGLFSLLRALIR